MLIGGAYRAISENDLVAVLSAATAPTLTAFILAGKSDPNVRQTMGQLFGGDVYVPVQKQTVNVPIKEPMLKLPGGEYLFRPSLTEAAFVLEGRRVNIQK